MPFFASRWWYALLPLPVALGAVVLSRPGLGTHPVLVVVGGAAMMYLVLWALRAGARARVGAIAGSMRCQNGHRVPEYASVCDECGVRVRSAGG
jgi:hypothetical protein